MTADQRLDAWVRFAAKAMGVVNSHLPDEELDACIRKTADAMLALVEQREREGRFGPPGDQGSFTLHAAKMGEDLQHWHDHAMKAEAEVGRLKAALNQSTKDFDGAVTVGRDQRARADKAESLLKEALGALTTALPKLGLLKLSGPAMGDPWGPPEHEMKKCRDVLARARQEGFEP